MLHACLLVDFSGSMASHRTETVVGINEYVSVLNDREPDASVSLIGWNSTCYSRIREDVRPAEFRFADDDFRPAGMTPLYDAIGKTVSGLLAGPQPSPGDARALVIVTDGLENASREFDRVSVGALLDRWKEAGGLLIYLGADHDAFSQSRGVGARRDKTMRFDKASSKEAMFAAGRATTSYSADVSGGKPAVAAAQDARFTEAERLRSRKERGSGWSR